MSKIIRIKGYEVTEDTFVYSSRGVASGKWAYYAAARYKIVPRKEGGYRLKLDASFKRHRSSRLAWEDAMDNASARIKKGDKAISLQYVSASTPVEVLDSETDFFRTILYEWEGAYEVPVALTLEDAKDLMERCQESSLVQLESVLCERNYAQDIANAALKFFGVPSEA